MNKTNIIGMWNKGIEYVKTAASLNWWFKLGDWVYEKRTGKPNNAGDFKFRTNMRTAWYVTWSSLIVLLPSGLEIFPFLAILWATYVWRKS